MKIKNIKSIIVIYAAAIVFGAEILQAADRPIKPPVKKGAHLTVIRGMTRSWQDVDKRPLNLRSHTRRLRPVLNFEYERPIVKKSTTPDPVVQYDYSTRGTGVKGRKPSIPNPLSSFNGMSLSANGAGWPPDTTGDVGQTYFVQGVNTSIGIFRKSNGSLVSAATFDDFFEGGSITGTPCDENNNGDPIVLYDQYAERWFILDFAWDPSETDGSYYSIAVSKTSDPAGDWWLYALRADNTLMNDYPKAGVWHDGIYITANMFQFTGGFQGVKVWALKKPDIYNGTLVSQDVYDTSWYAWSILPSNAKGSTPPPASAPNYMYSYDADEWGYSASDVLVVWKYDVDWNTPANTTWTGPSTITAAAFGLHGSDIPQQGTSYTLDSLYSRLMYPAVYRNFDTHESVYLTHLADVSGTAAIRWYEVRISGGGSSVYQQGTYAPDSQHRWMGSIAADKNGGIALGYSVSSSSMYPAVRYAGRLASDPLGTLGQGEATLIAGGGFQNYFQRWGDYSTMTIDPLDDETFWYTQEYYSTSGTDWQTRIGSFKISGSVSPPPGCDNPDFNNDEKVDLIWRNSSTGKNLVWYLNGVSITGFGNLSSVSDLNWTIAGTGDFNSDGHVDILWRNTSSGQNLVWYLNGVNVTGFANLPAVSNQDWTIAGTGDFNSDDKVDILWRNTSGGQNLVWYLNGVSVSGFANISPVGDQNWQIKGTGDFNSDNKIDILWRNTSSGQNLIWYLDGVSVSGFANLSPVSDQNWQIKGTGDFNSDNKLDIIWRNDVRGKNLIWYLDGVTITGFGNLLPTGDNNWKIVNKRFD